MLKVPAEFPYPGSIAFLAPDAEKVRIQQINADATVLVARMITGASGNLTVEQDRLFRTPECVTRARLAERRRRRAR